ncbi:MAG: hypothetical protein KBH14_01915, partial [Vicinamibacteria bacterium]|nr:hypothetical protein [Vicinamibacteria bacterium]
VSVLSASGSAAGSLAGFGGIAGGALGVAGIAGIVGGVLVGGAVVNEVTGGTPTPTATPTPSTPTPTPTATPTPTPQASCSVTVTTTPDAPGGDWGQAGTVAPPNTPGLQDGLVLFSALPRYCSVVVTEGSGGTRTISGTLTFPISCGVPAFFDAVVAPPTSKIGPLGATWGGDCGGQALGTANCRFPNGVNTSKNITLTCATR